MCDVNSETVFKLDLWISKLFTLHALSNCPRPEAARSYNLRLVQLLLVSIIPHCVDLYLLKCFSKSKFLAVHPVLWKPSSRVLICDWGIIHPNSHRCNSSLVQFGWFCPGRVIFSSSDKFWNLDFTYNTATITLCNIDGPLVLVGQQ